jgi:hypothetical protein
MGGEHVSSGPAATLIAVHVGLAPHSPGRAQGHAFLRTTPDTDIRRYLG